MGCSLWVLQAGRQRGMGCSLWVLHAAQRGGPALVRVHHTASCSRPTALSLMRCTAAEHSSKQVCRLTIISCTKLVWHKAKRDMQQVISKDSEKGAEQTCRVPLVDGCMDVEGSGFRLTFPRHHIALQQE